MHHRINIIADIFGGVLIASICFVHQVLATPASSVLPDVGHVSAQKVSAQGSGDTEEAALMQALKMAILETNGTDINMASASASAAADVNAKLGPLAKDAYFHSRVFVQVVKQSSKGLIDHFTITKVQKPHLFDRKFTISIDAFINKYHSAAASSKKLKLIVAPINSSQAEYKLGAATVSGAVLATQITQRITNALVQTERFDVLSRSGSSQIDRELAIIGAGKTSKENLAKLNQIIPADIILTGSIGKLTYVKHSRKVTISSYPLVSYKGRWAFSDKIINVTTREIIDGNRFSGKFPSIAPTTMPISVDAQGMLTKAEDAIVNDTVSQVLHELYPVTIVAIQGKTLVLSQGGSSVKVGKLYQLIKVGQKIKDPQTGDVIGHVKSPVGSVIIDRVNDRLSYGHMISGSMASLTTDGGVRIGRMLVAHVHAEQHSSRASQPATKEHEQADSTKNVHDSNDPNW